MRCTALGRLPLTLHGTSLPQSLPFHLPPTVMPRVQVGGCARLGSYDQAPPEHDATRCRKYLVGHFSHNFEHDATRSRHCPTPMPCHEAEQQHEASSHSLIPLRITPPLPPPPSSQPDLSTSNALLQPFPLRTAACTTHKEHASHTIRTTSSTARTYDARRSPPTRNT